MKRTSASIFSAIVALPLLAILARPGWAQCPQVEINVSIASVSSGTLNASDQATLNVGGSVTLQLFITRRSGTTSTTTNETLNPNTTFFTSPSRGTFSGPNGSVFTATAADCNLQFPIYARFHDTCTGSTFTDTVHITVRPCATLISPAFGSCPTTPVTVTAASGQCSAPVTFPALNVTGTPTPTLTCTAPIGPGGSVVPVTSGSTFPVGTTTVTCVASNTAGTATCTFTVIVRPPAPTISCPPASTVCVPAGSCTASVTISPTVTPACATTTTIVATLPGGGTVTVPAGTALTLPFGLTTITATATNVTGTASCTTSVLVLPLGQIEISATVAGATGVTGTSAPDQVTIHVGGTITVAVTITTPGCPSFSAVQAGTASFAVGTNLNVGSFSGNVFTAGAGAANRQFPIYARFTNPCTGLTYTDTIHVTVVP